MKFTGMRLTSNRNFASMYKQTHTAMTVAGKSVEFFDKARMADCQVFNRKVKGHEDVGYIVALRGEGNKPLGFVVQGED
jgi:hypothetical protein